MEFAQTIMTVMMEHVSFTNAIPYVGLNVKGMNYVSSMAAWMRLVVKMIMIVQTLTGVPKDVVYLRLIVLI